MSSLDRQVRNQSGESQKALSLGRQLVLQERGHTRQHGVAQQFNEGVWLGDKMDERNQGHMWILFERIFTLSQAIEI